MNDQVQIGMLNRLIPQSEMSQLDHSIVRHTSDTIPAKRIGRLAVFHFGCPQAIDLTRLAEIVLQRNVAGKTPGDQLKRLLLLQRVRLSARSGQ